MRGLVLVLALAATLGACVESAVVVCGDTVCPAGTTCSVHGCLSETQLAACANLGEGEPCQTESGNGICDDRACVLTICGNGEIEAPEICDDGNQVGGDGCNGTCTSDETCGNGITELAESCDCGDANHDSPASCMGTKNGGVLCSDTCITRRCGNNVLDPGEICDDGNQASGDGCSSTCASDETCGNGIAELDEVCDCGDATHPGPPSCAGTINGGTVCTDVCTSRRCGDGNPDPGEACDDGNQISGDGCNSTCSSDETCGNGIAELVEECDCGDAQRPGATACAGTFNGGTICTDQCKLRRCGDLTVDANEKCDDGNQTSGDGCNSTCTSDETCGNGIAELDEQCDCGDLTHPGAASCMGSFNGGAICSGACQLRQCGNNVLDPGEICDDGNQMGGDGCNSTCTSNETCGNGIAELAEECDCGNAQNPGGAGCLGTFNGGALCSATCMTRRCGNNVMDPGEVCDDGNQISGDGCNSTCTSIEACGNGIPELLEECDCGSAQNPGPSSCLGTYNGGSVCSATCNTRRCGNNLMDPGEVCDDGNQVSGDGCNSNCTSDETCGNGIAELAEECDCGTPSSQGAASCSGTYNGGTICSNTCLIRRCGNTQLDPGEVCDDGNDIPGDGCSAYCQSNETCPNGTVDFAVGEQCDEGDTRSKDGCSATCQVEPLLWQHLHSDQTPGARRTTMAYDAARGVTVLFGGFSDVALNDTWEFDGTTWTQRTPQLAPPARRDHAMAYDAKRGRVVMFGGNNAGFDFDDTWEYDGSTWTKINVTGPSARSGHAMVYDSTRHRIVLFGGVTFANNVQTWTQETWVYDGVSWSPLSPSSKPSVRDQHAMAYDPDRDVVVLFGGRNNDGEGAASNGTLGETWEFNGTNWTGPIVTTTVPQPRAGASMTYDPVRQRVLMYGGERWNPLVMGHVAHTTAYEYNGTDWTAAPAGPNPGRMHFGLAFDLRRGKSLLYGGGNYYHPLSAPNGVVYGETWQFDGTWFLRSVPAAIGPIGGAAMAFDSVRGRVVAYGGFTAPSTYSAKTWELVGDTWIEAVNGPPARSSASAAYDPIRRVLVIFGGSDSGGVLKDETWEYNGTAWAGPKVTTMKPSARFGHTMVYDPGRNRIVLFGGQAGGQTPLDDTWEYNGTDWAPLTVGAKPPKTRFHGMAYDRVRQRVVVWGGRGENDVYPTDVWELVTSPSATWQKRSVTNPPPGRTEVALAYDSVRHSLVMYGGKIVSELNDVWVLESSATAWQQYFAPTGFSMPGYRSAHTMAYDPVQQRMIVLGGSASQTILADTWSFGYLSVAVTEACSSKLDFDGDGTIGCADSDCWSVCKPVCDPDLSPGLCPAQPVCGDGTCGFVEDCRSCPGDCAVGVAACPIRCGDFFCDIGEAATCPGDCPP